MAVNSLLLLMWLVKSVLSVLLEASMVKAVQSTLKVNISAMAVHSFGGASVALGFPLPPQ